MKGLPLLAATFLIGAPPGTNNVLFMDGNSDYVEIQDSPSLSNLTQLTLEAWIYPFSGFFPTNGIEFVVAQFSSFGNERPYQLSWLRSSQRVRFAVNEDTNGTFFDGNIDVPPDTWTHVAGTHDGQSMRIYVNGQLDAEVPNSISQIVEFDVPIRIGAQAGGTNNWFPGLVDEARIWGVGRTQPQLQGGLGGLAPGDNQGLLGYWRMNDRNGTVSDSYIFGNDGLLNGDAALIGLDLVPTPSANGPNVKQLPLGPVDSSGNTL